MFNYPFYTNPTYYTPGIESGLLGGSSALNTAIKGSNAGGLLKGIASKWSWNGFLTSTGKTLNVINQAIPIFYQVRPIVQNAKTMFKVLGAVKESPSKSPIVTQQAPYVRNETPTKTATKTISEVEKTPSIKEGNPTFFL